MVAMQVRKNNRTDVVRVHSKPPHRNEGCRPAVNENPRLLSVQKNARLQSPAAAKRIAASEELDPHLIRQAGSAEWVRPDGLTDSRDMPFE
jgi:hypothetical protein